MLAPFLLFICVAHTLHTSGFERKINPVVFSSSVFAFGKKGCASAAAIYNRHDYFDERKAALNEWDKLLNALEEGRLDYNVVVFKKRFPASGDFDRFVGYLLNNALFIYVSTEDLDDAFRLFTILNDRGSLCPTATSSRPRTWGRSPAKRIAASGPNIGKRLRVRWDATNLTASCRWSAPST